MSSERIIAARREVYESLSLCNFCTRKIAISFIDEPPTSFLDRLKIQFWFYFSAAAVFTLVGGEIAFVISLLIGSTSVAEFVASLHIVGYGVMSLSKILTMWFKLPVFRQVVSELVELWPIDIDEVDSITLKNRTLTALRLGQFSYMFWNIFGLAMYSITPIVLHIFRLARGTPSDLGYIWAAIYPVDKTKPGYHEVIFVFEAFAGLVSVWSMLGSDLMFTSMSSHISMLLRLLQFKIRSLGHTDTEQLDIERNDIETGNQENADCYDEIISVIKIHQRLISYSNDLEDVFSMVNLINVLLSSVNICCVVFNIVLLEPWMEVSNKFFLGAALTQVGILCWYADDIFRASIGVADAVYESGWYKNNKRCRRALLLLLQRSQKPLYFTALKFRSITMTTYTSILTTSYSYFALLYTMYNS